MHTGSPLQGSKIGGDCVVMTPSQCGMTTPPLTAFPSASRIQPSGTSTRQAVGALRDQALESHSLLALRIKQPLASISEERALADDRRLANSHARRFGRPSVSATSSWQVARVLLKGSRQTAARR